MSIRSKSLLALSLTIFFSSAAVSAKAAGQEQNSKIILLEKKEQNPKLTNMLNNVEKILGGVSKVRQLNIQNKVTVGVKSTKELNQFLQNMFTKEYPDKDIKRDYLLLERLGLIKKNTNLRDTFLNLYTEQIAGFYDDQSKALYLIENSNFGGLEFSIIISHELVHALQDQNYNLKQVLETHKNGDASLARMALVEGEAMVASMQYQVKNFSLDSLAGISGLLKGAFFNTNEMQALKHAPGFLVEQMTFPYIEGAKFVQALYNNAGNNWEKFGGVYKKLPGSTEQIMHPEKYLENEQPLKVPLNEKFLNDKNWIFLQKDTFGEFFMMNYFLEYLNEAESKKAAAGWGGDTYAIYSNPAGDDSLFIFKTIWDTPKDAAEFYRAYIKSLVERYNPELKILQQTENRFEADTPRGKVSIILNNNSVNIAEGFTAVMKKNITDFLTEK